MISWLFIAAVQLPSNAVPVRSEVIRPIRSATFNKNGAAKERKQGGNARTIEENLVFEGSQDGNRQVDPQIAVGGNHVLHGTNSGIVIYDKKGNWVQGVPQSEFNGGIDPKMFFDIHNRVFAFDLWNPWDEAKLKPVNVSVSETSNPTGAWNTYPVPAPGGVDGGGIGHSRKWLGYSFPGGPEQTFVMKMEEVKSGKPANVWHFSGNLGHPVNTLDRIDDLYFVKLNEKNIVLTKVGANAKGEPVVREIIEAPHGFKYFSWPPQSPMKGVDVKTASGDRNPKALVIYHGQIWFSHAIGANGRAGVQWHSFALDGKKVRSGEILSEESSFIQTTLAVNRTQDVLVGYQETSPAMFISARASLIPAKGSSKLFRFREGLAATEGGSWGDYSCTVVDGDNLNDFWTIQSFANARGRGGTVIAQIKR